jgi:hypothetical protein
MRPECCLPGDGDMPRRVEFGRHTVGSRVPPYSAGKLCLGHAEIDPERIQAISHCARGCGLSMARGTAASLPLIPCKEGHIARGAGPA